MRTLLLSALLGFGSLCFASTTFKLEQSIPSNGARGVKSFTIAGKRYLAIAQLAKDVPGTKADMNGGDSDLPTQIYRYLDGQFHLHQSIPSHGNEDLAFFTIGKASYLAIASIRSGSAAPYNLHSYSKLYKFNGDVFYPVQQFAGFASKGVTAFQMGEDHYLGFANGVSIPGVALKGDTRSALYRWDGEAFKLFQRFNTKWAYSMAFFEVDHQAFLAISDHAGASVIYRFDGKQFKAFQTLSEMGGRMFQHFRLEGNDYLAYANLTHDSQILKWDGERFAPYQVLKGKAGRVFDFFEMDGKAYLFQMKYMTGSREAPKVVQDSVLYQWQDKQFKPVQTLKTSGGAGVDYYKIHRKAYLVVSNSLSSDLRFANKTEIYRLLEVGRN